MTRLKISLLLAFCVVLIAYDAKRSIAQDAVRTDDPLIVGKWTATENSKLGPITLVKEHKDGTTTLTAFDNAKRVLFAKRSEYYTEKHGDVKVFVFSNSIFTAGPDAGKSDKRTKSYVYRVDDKKFYEVRGMIDGVDEAPALVVWDRIDSPTN